jgi:NAD(P)-dependent dehydrogenase (short-subunit alcohol dehydrogenase family)
MTDQRMAGQVALVFGAGSGIGRGAALAAASAGATVVSSDINLEAAQRTADEVGERGAKVVALACDVADAESVEQVVHDALAFAGRIDCVVVSALPPLVHYPVEEFPEDRFEREWRVGVLGLLHVFKQCSAALGDSKGLVIVFGSANGIEGTRNRVSYNGIKEAVRAMARTVAREWAPRGIRVNSICPVANSPAMENYSDNAPDLFAATLASIPLGRLGDCEQDIGRAIVYLATDGAFVTGQTLMVDGGMTMR